MKNIFLMLILSITITACSASNQIQGSIGLIDNSSHKLNIKSGIVPAAAQGVVTPEGYKVSSSVGAWVSEVKFTNVQGYKVYQSVEGHIVGE